MTRLLVFAVLLASCSANPDNTYTGSPPDLGTDLGQANAVPNSWTDAAFESDFDVAVPDTGSADEGGGLRDAALIAALRRDAASVMIVLGYNDARDRMYAAGGIDDRGGRIEGLYTGRTVDTDGTRTPSANCRLADDTPTTCVFNTEHTFARIHLRNELVDQTPEYLAAEGDLHHLFPSDELANNARGNFDFGDTPCEATNSCAFAELSELGLPPGSNGSPNCPMTVDVGEDLCVMEVRPERRGDVARAQFYMSMRYGLDLPAEVEVRLRAWNSADVPDSLETERNQRIEQAQGNRNPFIDDPTLVDRIADF